MPRGKTFTGCWTCRDRRLKCDEVRPRCNKCTSKGIVCAGYDSRLHWLRPGNLGSSEDSRTTAGKGVQRRRLLPANGIERLSDDQLDLLLSKIDEGTDRGRHYFQAPFGVFSFTSHATIHGVGPEAKDALKNITAPNVQSPASDLDDGSNANASASTTSIPTTSEHGHPDNLRAISTAHATLHRSQIHSTSPLPGQGTPLWNTSPTSYLYTVSPGSHTSLVFGATPASTSTLGEHSPDTVQFLTAEIKFLLNHYRANVLPFFSVMDNMHTPWRVLHFPKALQAACNYELGHSAAGPSSILLYAILTTSAYSLLNSEKKRRNQRSSHHWEEVATRCKGEALNLLQTYIGNLSDDRAESEYHELLAAMLSMVTVDVMCGDTRTCEVHLQACETLIGTYVKASPDDLSLMSKALHTTFIYLRVMQQATAVSSHESHAEVESPRSHETPSNFNSVSTPLLRNDYVALVDLGDVEDVSFTSYSSELIYGFPVRLLFFLRATIQIASAADHSSRYTPSPGLQAHIATVREDLEDAIMDWPVENITAKFKLASLKPGNLEIMEHYTRAFHHAIIIYFLDQVHRTRPRLLQQYVVSVICHLEQVEEAKMKHNIIAGPLLWPAFTAASHATDSTIRNRFIDWLEGSDQMGVGTSKATIDLLKQIWCKTKDSSSASRQEAIHAISQARLVLT